MALKLLGHFWKIAKPASLAPVRRQGSEPAVAPRDAVRRILEVAAPAAPSSRPRVPGAVEPIWAETQPWCHD
ncbi:MAG: hypothetical protein ACXWUL_02325 [Caldimonas sp.]